MELSIVIPVHNEAGNIEPLVQEIYTALAGLISYEIIYVDDGSTDSTLQELKKVQSHSIFLLSEDGLNEFKIIRHQIACGQSTALQTGIQAAQAVNHRPRVRGHSHYGIHNRLWVGMTDLLGVLWLQKRVRLPVIKSIEEIKKSYDTQ
jgi:glycosyltransferase involved in cell wall biosynthesis